MLPIPAPEPVSAHELDLLAMTLAGTGASVVTENSGAMVVLKAAEPTSEVEQLADGMMEAGNGQMVTSDGEGLLGWTIVAATDSTVEPSSDVNGMAGAEVDSKSVVAVHGVPVEGGIKFVVDTGSPVRTGPGADDRELAGGQIVKTSGDWVGPADVRLPPELENREDQRGSVSDVLDTNEVGLERGGNLTETVEAGTTGVTEVDAGAVNKLGLPITMISVVNTRTVEEPCPRGTV